MVVVNFHNVLIGYAGKRKTHGKTVCDKKHGKTVSLEKKNGPEVKTTNHVST